MVHFAVGTSSFLWENVARLDRLVTAIHAQAEAVLEQIEPPALLLHENHWTESMRLGWVWSFPKRFRSDRDPIVTYPRGAAKFLPGLLERYKDRECWYYRLEPATAQSTARSKLQRCEDAMDELLRRRDPGVALRIASTAERMGLISVSETYAGRRQIEKGAVGMTKAPPPE